METVLISKVVRRDGQKPWKVYDGNAVEYVTWDDGVGTSAANLETKQAQIDFEVQNKTGRDGKVFVNRLLKDVQAVPEPMPANATDSYEPTVNTGKQVVIIRQSSWNQANAIYDKAVSLYRMFYRNVDGDDLVLDIHVIHAIAWQLFSSSPRPENSNMHTIAFEIEKLVRLDWFPMTDSEIPF